MKISVRRGSEAATEKTFVVAPKKETAPNGMTPQNMLVITWKIFIELQKSGFGRDLTVIRLEESAGATQHRIRGRRDCDPGDPPFGQKAE